MDKIQEPPAPEVIETIEARYDYTEKERSEVAQQLVTKMQEKRRIEEEAKASAADWKKRVKQSQIIIEELENRFSSGFEMRQTECTVVFFPKKRRKEYIRTADGQKVAERDMDANDFQLHFPPTPPEPQTAMADAFKEAEALDATAEEETAETESTETVEDEGPVFSDVPAEPPTEEVKPKKRGRKPAFE